MKFILYFFLFFFEQKLYAQEYISFAQEYPLLTYFDSNTKEEGAQNKIQKIYVQEGDIVEKNQILLTFHDEVNSLRLDIAKKELEQVSQEYAQILEMKEFFGEKERKEKELLLLQKKLHLEEIKENIQKHSESHTLRSPVLARVEKNFQLQTLAKNGEEELFARLDLFPEEIEGKTHFLIRYPKNFLAPIREICPTIDPKTHTRCVILGIPLSQEILPGDLLKIHP